MTPSAETEQSLVLPNTDQEQAVRRQLSALMMPLEALSALLMIVIIGLLLTAVLTRYVFSQPLIWVDEIV